MLRKFSITIILVLLMFNYSIAQEESVKNNEPNDSEFIVGTDLVSRYMWRGLDLGSAPAIQPSFSWNKGGFSVGTWGSYSLKGSQSINENFAEVDLMLSYNYKFVTVALVDFFFPVEGLYVNNNYFNYKAGETTHIIESAITFTGPENIPLNFMIATVLYGADLDANQDNIYSTYLELTYPMQINKIDFEVFIGGVVNDKPNMYGNGSGVINLGFKASKAIKISDEYSMGTFLSMILNPKYESIHLVVGLSF